MNLTDELDRSFGSGPAHPPVDQVLAAGRRGLRRRRATSALAAAAVLAVVGGGWALAGPGDAQRAVGPASDPTASPSESIDTTPSVEEGPWETSDQSAAYTLEGGELVLREGWSIVDRIDSPLRGQPIRTTPGDDRSARRSVALETTDGDQRQWLLLWWKPGRGGSTDVQLDPAGTGFDSLEQWSEVQVSYETGADTTELVEFTGGGSLSAVGQTEILEQRPGIDLGSGFAPPGAPTAASHVASGDDDYWVVSRDIDGISEHFIALFPGSDRYAESMPDFVRYLDSVYGDIEGSSEGAR